MNLFFMLVSTFSLTAFCAEGVTFLALGNGAPDIFSAIAAFSRPHTAGLAVGALFGKHGLTFTKKRTTKLKVKVKETCLMSFCSFPLSTQEPVYLSPPWLQAAWRWSSLSSWLPVRFCVMSASTWWRCFGLSSCCTEKRQRSAKPWVHAHKITEL